MAPTSERPPSEQGIEYRLLDGLTALQERLQRLEERPALWSPSPNWWDQLPPEAEPLFWGHWVQEYQLYAPNAYPPRLRIQQAPDRIELTLLRADMIIVWQRALFLKRPAA